MATGDDKLRGGVKGDAARRERLAAELRTNLRKRKAQARARQDQIGATNPPDASDPKE